jgi:rhomboid protease GluP
MGRGLDDTAKVPDLREIMSISEPAVAPPTIPPQAPATALTAPKLPWLTFALLAVLILIFVIENAFPVSPGKDLSPSVATLLAMGGLSRDAVLTNGEWYRLFTAPLLHGGVIHILGNSVALLLGGRLLEQLVGRLWFFAFFVVGALGGSLMSLAVGAANAVSVGASGALMGMFAALLVGSLRLPAGTPIRQRLQASSLQVLIPSLLPIFSAPAIGKIDYGAHFGGALSGAALAVILLQFWPPTQRFPQLRMMAAGIALAGAIAFVVSAGIVVANYGKHDVVLIPPDELPRNLADGRARAADFVARYPGDPRAHLFLGDALAAGGKDNAGAERELRLALAGAHALSATLGPRLELGVRTSLAVFLDNLHRKDEAKEIARPLCAAPEGDNEIEPLSRMMINRSLCQ